MRDVDLQARDDNVQPTNIKSKLHLVQRFLRYTQIPLLLHEPSHTRRAHSDLYVLSRPANQTLTHLDVGELARSFFCLIFHKSCRAREVIDRAIWRNNRSSFRLLALDNAVCSAGRQPKRSKSCSRWKSPGQLNQIQQQQRMRHGSRLDSSIFVKDAEDS